MPESPLSRMAQNATIQYQQDLQAIYGSIVQQAVAQLRPLLHGQLSNKLLDN